MPDSPFRAQLGEPHHVAYLVEDIEETVGRLVDQLGAGPFFHIERVPLENVRSRGEPAAPSRLCMRLPRRSATTSRSMPTTKACVGSSPW